MKRSLILSYSSPKLQDPSQKKFTARGSLLKGILKRLGGFAVPSYRSSNLYHIFRYIVKYLESSRKICYILFSARKITLSLINCFIRRLVRWCELRGVSIHMPGNEHTDLSLE